MNGKQKGEYNAFTLLACELGGQYKGSVLTGISYENGNQWGSQSAERILHWAPAVITGPTVDRIQIR